ncbi:MAG: hypothetical protein NTZ08_02600 [Verrucomicrobia bacterium]|nr:hypothetical protein [Verrucomicrobiota bacterium]
MKPFYFPLVLLASAALLQAQTPDPVAEAATLSNQGRHSEASAILQKATDSNPGDEGLRFRLATALVFDRRNAEARTIFSELAKSWNADIASMAASSLTALDRAEAIEKAAREQPPSAETLRREAEYRARQARLDRQQAAYELINARRDEEAVRAIDDLERQGEVTPELIIEKSAALQRMGDTLAAIVVLRDVAAGDNPDPRARLQLAALLAEQGRRAEAFEIWRDLRDQGGDATLSRVAAAEIEALAPSYNLERWTWGELDLYGTYLSRYNIGVSSGRLREGTFIPGARWIEPFVQADFSLDSSNTSNGQGPGQGIPTIYNENLAGFHAGARIRPFANQSLVLYVLGGIQKDLRGTEQHNGEWFAEIIAGINGYWAWGPGKEWTAIDLEGVSPGGLPTLPSTSQASRWALNNWSPVQFRLDWFVEAGGDAAYYSRLPDCLAYGQSRQGARIMQFGKAAAVDIYGLENLTMDTKGNYYDNYFEAGPGMRFVTAPVGAAVLTTSVDYVFGSYLGRNSNNTRGDTAANYSDFRLTVALSLRW